VRILLQIFQKVQIGHKQIFLKIKMGTKKAKFYADFRSAGKIAKQCMQKSNEQISQQKVHFFGFTYTLLLVIIFEFFQQFCTHHTILRFFHTHFDYVKIFLGVPISTFWKRWEQNALPKEQNMGKFLVIKRFLNYIFPKFQPEDMHFSQKLPKSLHPILQHTA